MQKLIALTLVSYLSLLAVSPLVCELFGTTEKGDLCCSADNAGQCSEEQSKNEQPSDPSDNDAPCVPCCFVQNGHSYFVTVSSFDFTTPLFTVTRRIQITNELILSDYLSDCWRPPEIPRPLSPPG